MSTIEHRLSKAKAALILDHPFIGSVAMTMPFEMVEGIETARTNGKRVQFDPAFVETLTDSELMFVVAHECFHPMLEHCYRRDSRDPKKWNIAADYVINQLLTGEGIGTMPEIGCLNPALYAEGGGTSEGIYAILPDETGEDGEGFQDCEDGKGDQAEQAQQAAEWKVKVAQAAQAAKMMGKLSAGMKRLVNEVLRPKVDWREVLQQFVQKARVDTRSWARPNRRWIAQGLYIPSVSGEVMGEIVIAVDCSGSVSQEELDQFAAEVVCVSEDHQPAKLHIIYFDTEVSYHDELERGDEVVLTPHGGGGTAFSPVFEYVAEHDIEPVACVVLTDLYCDDFGPEPDYPVMWVTSSDRTIAPWGEVIEMVAV